MKELILLIPLGSALLLTGCAGTESEFECNATTSDTCMTMEQANEKAKTKEENSEAKPVAAGLPRLADGNFRTTPVNSYPLPSQPNLSQVRTTPVVPVKRDPSLLLNNTAMPKARGYSQPLVTPVIRPVSAPAYTSPSTVPGQYPRPLRSGEQITSLWIAPYVDSDDVYHQPSTVLFVVTPSAWGQPRIN
ncbi:type IV conjugative transfer system lipoprotein TraV [Enterobacter sp. ECC-019]|uniref:type IV conjugative transfer system lipoprotein TraV n=1 Tax=Enterobacter sp. ECC-019 TaxID=3116478 RepID=UPI003753FCFA